MLSKKKKGPTKSERQTTLASFHFRARAIDMIDVLLANKPRVSHVVFLIEFILDTLPQLGTSDGDNQLRSRLVSTFKKIAALRNKVEFFDT